MAECRSCKARIVWLKTKQGNNMPVDYDTFEQGTERLFEVSKGHISHFATCPDSDKHRKPR